MSAIDQFIYTIRPTRLEMLTEGPTAEETEIVSQHFEHLKTLAEKGIVVLAGRTQTADERTFGVVILNAATHDEAQDLVASDPAVREGVMGAELYPFRVAVMASAK